MKTKELMEILQQCDPEQEVSFQIDDGCCGDSISLNCYDYEHSWDYNKETRKFDVPGWAVLRFGHLPGYRSCRQSSGTQKAHEEYWARFDKKEKE
jgi:hypothetical protein